MIRHYRHEDADAVIAIWRAASDLAHPFLSRSFQDKAEILIRDTYLHEAEIWVYEVDGTVRGFIGLFEDFIGALFVHPDAHGRGMGRALVDKAVTEKGALCVEVFVENDIGRRFYRAYGFVGNKQITDPHSGYPLLQLQFEP